MVKELSKKGRVKRGFRPVSLIRFLLFCGFWVLFCVGVLGLCGCRLSMVLVHSPISSQPLRLGSYPLPTSTTTPQCRAGVKRNYPLSHAHDTR